MLKKRKTVYIAGKISDNPTFQRDFSDAVVKLKMKGYVHIINPCCMSNLNLDYEQFMKICFTMIDVADCVYFLSTWQDSEGAKREMSYALSKNKELLYDERD